MCWLLQIKFYGHGGQCHSDISISIWPESDQCLALSVTKSHFCDWYWYWWCLMAACWKGQLDSSFRTFWQHPDLRAPFFLYLLLPIRAHKGTVMSRTNDQQVRHILKSIILLCASHLSLSSSRRLGFFARTGTATLARPLERLIFNLVVSLVSETSTRFRLRHPQWGP